MEKQIKRFCKKFKKTKGCWEWKACKTSFGYGRFAIKIKNRLWMEAHRVSYEFFVGKIPKGKWILHRCDNPGCVNPKHLFVGTNKDNIEDKMKKGRHRCGIGQNHGRAKLNNKKIEQIRRCIKNTDKKILAKKYQISLGHLNKIIRRDNWSHI